MLLLALQRPVDGAGRLVRCVSGSDVPCLVTAADSARVVVLGNLDLSDLGRIPQRSAAGLPLRWHPGFVALPVMRGTVDTTRLGADIRSALEAGGPVSGQRPMVAAILALGIAALAWLIPALSWRQSVVPADAVELEVTVGTETGPAAAPPRSPDATTRYTARRTALRR